MKFPKKIQVLTTDEELDMGHNMIEKYNIGKTPNFDGHHVRYAFISVGQKTKLFTLWTFSSIRFHKPESFITSLSNNFVVAVEKAIEYCNKSNLPIYIDQEEVFSKEENHYWKFLTFGKYKGRHIDELLVEDIRYTKWLLDNNLKRWHHGYGIGELGKYIVGIRDNINTLYKEYNEIIALENSEDSDLSYVGIVGEKYKFEVEVIKVIDLGEYKFYKMKDINNNIIVKSGRINQRYISEKGKDNTGYNVEVGDKLKFTSDVRNQYIDKKYNLGEKQTKIGRLSKF